MYTEKDLVRVARREKNNRRKYLVVNRLQGKHIPADPAKTLAMFDELARPLTERYRDRKVLVIGFAETATAIGSRLAIRLNSLYIQTTREQTDHVEYLYFTESHSHAAEQKLIKTDLDQVMDEIDEIIFAEDEVTTGNTILKLVRLIRNTYGTKVHFSVASLINGMDAASERVYEENHICVHYLVKTDHSGYSGIAEGWAEDGSCLTPSKNLPLPEIRRLEPKGYVDGRRLLKGEDYDRACESLWRQISGAGDFTGRESVLVLGTEEFMYPAIYAAYRLAGMGCEVRTHSTTRSPIAVSREEAYPLHCRYELRSLYEDGRRTFVYDIGCYDRVIVMTDSANTSEEGVEDLCRAAAESGNSHITVIRWRQ